MAFLYNKARNIRFPWWTQEFLWYIPRKAGQRSPSPGKMQHVHTTDSNHRLTDWIIETFKSLFCRESCFKCELDNHVIKWLNQVHESHFLPTAVPICHAQQDPNEAPNTRRAWESWGVLCCLVLWMCSCLLRWTCLATSQNGSKAKTPTWQFQTYIWGNL